MASTLTKSIIKAFINAQIFVYRRSKGKWGGTLMGQRVLLLTTTGRKSGLARTTPVMYIREGDQYLITATAAGSDHHPLWFLNLQNKPEAKIEVDDQTLQVRAQITDDAESATLYEQFKALGNNFVQYQQKTRRIIPVIRLIPV